MTSPQHHVVVFGATSFVGKIICRYLTDHYGTGGELTWAAAGRSKARLEELRASLGSAAAKLPLIVADAADEESLRRLCATTRVVLSTVGPYALYGEPLVKVCAETGTDYCDLAGEVQWIRRMIDRYEDTARSSGARLVPCCGFDSIPSDLGVHFLEQQALARFGMPCPRVKMRVRAMRGGASGGTVASLINVVKEAAEDPSLRKLLKNPYALCPPGSPTELRQPSTSAPQFDADFGNWVAPFVMSAINTRVVQRSNALSEQAWGKDFRYDEAVMTGRGVKGRVAAMSMAAGLTGIMVAGALRPARWALTRFVLPKPGEGPGPEQQQQGYWDLRFLGTTADGKQLRVRVKGEGDPGYGSTARMIGQAAACLALDVGASRAGGFWTPATIFGDALIERLRTHSRVSFEVLEG
jgi:short subunit dehydrogenase-like uncharacterized protein